MAPRPSYSQGDDLRLASDSGSGNNGEDQLQFLIYSNTLCIVSWPKVGGIVVSQTLSEQSAAAIIARFLKQQGVRRVFGR